MTMANDDGHSCLYSLVTSVLQDVSRIVYKVLINENKTLNICVFFIDLISLRNDSRARGGVDDSCCEESLKISTT